MTDVWTLDFETQAIEQRPAYPPEPVGLAVRAPSGASQYMAWGHPTGNNTTREDALRALHVIWDSGLPVLCHNAKFDTAVAMERMGLPALPWDRVHDTMFLAFLLEPHARTISLKPLAEKWLGMPPDEQDAVADWVMAHRADMPLLPNGKRVSRKSAGAFIGRAPAELVAPYAIGDVERTWRLFQVMYPAALERGMGEAYDVERQLMPVLMENERVGIRLDMERLERETDIYTQWFDWVEGWLRTRLNSQGLNFDADADVADALDRCGIVTDWVLTPTGQRSVSKDNLHPSQFHDPQVAQMLGWRNRAKTCLKMFMEPWLAQGRARGGVMSAEWNQVAGEHGGARTGRPSTRNPNLLNISKDFDNKDDGYVHPSFIEGLPPLPLVRHYITADEGHVLNGRDFKSQEIRVFAHFEQGDLLRQFQADPELDVHDYVGAQIERIAHQHLGRGRVKILNFQGIYGGGVPAAQKAMRCTLAEARAFKDMHDKALPGRRILSDELTTIVRSGRAVRTYGGRLYTRAPLRYVDGRMRDFDYKMLNYLVQGSAADITKRAILRMLAHPDYNSRFLLNYYDEIVVSSPEEDWKRQSEIMREAMEGVPLRAKLLTDPEVGRNWGDMVEVKE